jgi:hypothetical protein
MNALLIAVRAIHFGSALLPFGELVLAFAVTRDCDATVAMSYRERMGRVTNGSSWSWARASLLASFPDLHGLHSKPQ